ncbi:hypothetical protein K431DRAFT_322687 [Polychaeton citri CBS 116435]|uniref:TPR-like protein n=1 Tax=Polychaeton citri CBS 116435 TaxID=1314669 RepID=A0A9P4PZZ2_9PEZI|nr:hypothetical protein K431DRAFT_322687 [Polychaeton citri CBS 116435]
MGGHKGTSEKPTFLTVPPEIREQIYALLFRPSSNRRYHEDEYTSYEFANSLKLFLVNRQIYFESRRVFYQLNTFVRIETPWPQAQEHVMREGHVPIVMSDSVAAKFDRWTLGTMIEAPGTPIEGVEMQYFVIHVDDLEKFAQMWYYANLSHPELNPHLELTLKLRDPFNPADEEKRVPLGLQERLILPFGRVRNLRGTLLLGDLRPITSVEKELRRQQAQPQNTPEECLNEAVRLKGVGNDAMRDEKYTEALQRYNEAWRAIHVVISGRQRHIHADAFFGRVLQDAPYTGKNGQSERLILRVHLVANTCLAYLKLENWLECRFWGERSINMLREAMGADDRREIAPEEEAILAFPAADQMGKIYYRAAVACKHMGDLAEARRLLKVARLYLPNDPNIGREQAAVALRF